MPNSKPPVKQTDRDATGRFIEGNKIGNRFDPGVSGNPAGPPRRKTQLWVWFCKYMEMTDQQLEKLDQSKLTQAQQSALKLVQNMKSGKGSGSECLARHVFNREEGKPVEHIIFENEDVLTDDECQEIREALIKNYAE